MRNGFGALRLLRTFSRPLLQRCSLNPYPHRLPFNHYTLIMIYKTRRAHSARLRNDSSRPKTRFYALPPHGIEHSMYPSLEGMNVLITGSARGIGLATARNLASLKAKVILADLSSVADAEGHIKDHVARADIIRAPKLDLGSVSSVHSFADWMAKEARPLHLLINNAGANFMGVDPWKTGPNLIL